MQNINKFLSLLTNFILHTLQKYVNAFISAIKCKKEINKKIKRLTMVIFEFSVKINL